MMTLKITTKRQATLPKALCEEMQLRAGDRLGVERRTVDGVDAWVLRPLPAAERPSWISSLRRYAKGKSHDLDAIRRSAHQAMGTEGAECDAQ